MMAQLQVGTATVDVTPPLGTNMAGYAGRDHGAEGIHDPLMAKALVLDDGRTKVLLITCDIISFQYSFTDALIAQIEERTGIPGSHVLVSNSHTHSGPMTRGPVASNRVDDQYTQVLSAKLRSVAEMALEELRPATLNFGSADVRVGHNRREYGSSGMTIGFNPDGPLAPSVDVMALRAQDGGLIAAWFCHAAHAVVLGPGNYLISADYPGEAQRAVEAVHTGATAMFAQGCCGDINADRGSPGTFNEVASCGRKLAGAVLVALEETSEVPSPALDAAKKRLELPLRDPGPPEQIEEELERLQILLQESRAEEDAVQERILMRQIERQEMLLEMARGGTSDTKRFDLTALRIGPAALVGLAGEVFVRYAQHIAALSPFSPTIVAAYTNGMIGYVPTADAFPRGGYEVDSSWNYYGGIGIAPASEEIILSGAKDLLASLNR